jgi:flagellar hook-associated protein 1 FlgK
MGAGSLMSIGIKTLEANYAGLQVTGHNIANAHVTGYSRQKIELATAEGQFSGAGFFGKGVDVVSVKRIYSDYLTREANSTNAAAQADATRLRMLETLEQAFQTGEQGIGYAANQFLNAMVDLANRPADSSTREVVLARATEMALRFSASGRQIETMQRSIVSDARTQVTAVNQLAKNIAQANDKISQVSGLGQPPNDLLDERDRLVSQLNALVQVNTVMAADGSMSVFLGGGHMLVLGSNTNPLTISANQDDPTRAAIAVFDGETVKNLDDDMVPGGSLVGLLRFQNKDLVDARNLLGRLAAAVSGAVNQQQQLGVNLYPPYGSVPSEPIFEVGGPQSIANANNARDAGGGFMGQVTVTISDPSQLKPSDYSLATDPSSPGQWLLTRLTDGHTQSIVSGDVVDGFRVDIGPPSPDVNDRFLLQPVGRAAGMMRVVVDDVRDLAAASPLVATSVPTPTGTVSVDSLKMLTAPPNPDHTVRIAFTDDSGHYTWDLLDPAGAVVGGGSGTWTAGGTIPAPPDDMNGFEMRLLGVPRLGDEILVAPAEDDNFAQNNGNALILAKLRDELIVEGATVGDAYAAAMADVGVRVQGGRSTAQITGALADAAEAARGSESGVNLDEEAARLIQYQQGYQAAAKVLQAAQSILQALLDASGG